VIYKTLADGVGWNTYLKSVTTISFHTKNITKNFLDFNVFKE